jgi:hypothetical protein
MTIRFGRAPYRKTLIGYSFIAVRKKIFQKFGGYLLFLFDARWLLVYDNFKDDKRQESFCRSFLKIEAFVALQPTRFEPNSFTIIFQLFYETCRCFPNCCFGRFSRSIRDGTIKLLRLVANPQSLHLSQPESL